jgi:autotransporter-associated beta strand protein
MKAGIHGLRRRQAAVLIAMSLSLSACGGGGGGNTRPTAPPPAPPPPSSPPAPAPPPPPQPPIDAQLNLTDTYAAHDAGYDGTGVVIGVVDSGIMRNHPALAGRVSNELIYVDPTQNNTKIDDVVGHGTWVSEIAAGKPFGQFVGGIAPGATLVSARIINDQEPTDDGSGNGNRVGVADAQFFSSVNDDLISNGVKVMNNSWGGLYWDATDTATTQAFDAAYSKFVNPTNGTQGGLVVFAAGNDSKPDPSDVAALPSRAPDLKNGWIVAVALDSLNPTQLASYSNACGIAQSYCLAAPGNVIVSGKDDTPGSESYWIVEGTSFAAPEVSGAAALVWQAFPYFSNSLVQQTLLGTAKDLGAPGPDPVFGYGALDVGAAINGPEKFDWSPVTVSFSGTSNWNNPISGAYGLTKQGDGTLNLTQPSTYLGGTNVQGGVLNAVSLQSGVNISAGAQFSASAVVGNVTNDGTVALGKASSTISGSYTQSSTGRLAVLLGTELDVTGHAQIDGDLMVIGKTTGYVTSSHTTVLTATNGVSGTFATLSQSSNVPLLQATPNYDANSAWLNVQQVKVTQVGDISFTAASFGAAQRVDNAFGQINNQLTNPPPSSPPPAVNQSFIDSAAKIQQTPTTAALQQSLQSLSGQLHAASAAMTFEAIDAGTQALSDRFDQLLTGPTSGGWSQTLGYHGSMSRSGFNSVGYDLNGWMVGQDYKFGSNGVAGFAVSQAQGLGRLSESADQGNSRSVEGMLYGGLIKNDWYTMGRVGVGNYREDMRRNLLLGVDNAAVASDSLGRYEVAYGESGYRFHLGNALITPYMNLQYAQIERSAINELGGDGFGLKSGGQNIERWQAGLGVRTTQSWSLGSGGNLGLQFRFLWQQAFAMRGDVFDASFDALNQWAPVGGIGVSRYGGVAGATLNWDFNKRSSLVAGYDQHFDQHQLGKTGTLTYRLQF